MGYYEPITPNWSADYCDNEEKDIWNLHSLYKIDSLIDNCNYLKTWYTSSWVSSICTPYDVYIPPKNTVLMQLKDLEKAPIYNFKFTVLNAC
jgi:hypothetical protein